MHALTFTEVRRRLLARTLTVALLLGAICWSGAVLSRCDFEPIGEWP